MTSTDTDDEQCPTTECRVCQTDVPAGEYCGLCGCHLTPRRGEGPDWLRIRDFGAAPDEHLLQPSLASSLFPHLPPRSRSAFRLGLVVLLVALVAFALLRLPAALITVAALGLPFLFLLYLRESDAFTRHAQRAPGAHRGARHRARGRLGAPDGCAWSPRSYGVALGAGVVRRAHAADGHRHSARRRDPDADACGDRAVRSATHARSVGRLHDRRARRARRSPRAATLTRLAPQFGTGVVSKRPMESLLVEAGIRGVAVPLTAAAAGGLIGAALWFTRPPSKTDQHPGVVRAILVAFAAAVLVVYVGLGLIDVARFPQVLMLVLYLALALVALLLLRVGLHLALLHEAHDEIQSDEPLLCTHCGHVVPDMAFCPACGVATRASSRSSRRHDVSAPGAQATRSPDGS